MDAGNKLQRLKDRPLELRGGKNKENLPWGKETGKAQICSRAEVPNPQEWTGAVPGLSLIHI